MVQVCKAGVARLRKIWLTRHGESEYNEKALIGGNSNLTPAGQIYARLLPDAIVDRVPLVGSCYTVFSPQAESTVVFGASELHR